MQGTTRVQAHGRPHLLNRQVSVLESNFCLRFTKIFCRIYCYATLINFLFVAVHPNLRGKSLQVENLLNSYRRKVSSNCNAFGSMIYRCLFRRASRVLDSVFAQGGTYQHMLKVYLEREAID